jgi:hypothetical protein
VPAAEQRRDKVDVDDHSISQPTLVLHELVDGKDLSGSSSEGYPSHTVVVSRVENRAKVESL